MRNIPRNVLILRAPPRRPPDPRGRGSRFLAAKILFDYVRKEAAAIAAMYVEVKGHLTNDNWLNIALRYVDTFLLL